jgi:hypothetical protein
MHNIRLVSVFAAALIAGMLPAAAQNQPKSQQPPPPAAAQNPPKAQQAPPPAAAKPYKAVAITAPKPMSDAGFDDLRKQIGEAVKRKDRAALGKLVVAQGFFWQRENGDGADKRKPGADNLAAALGLNNKDGAGWDMLAGYSEDPTAAPSPDHKDAICAPADPSFNGKEFEDLLKSSQTDATEWGYPVSAGIDVHAAAQTNSPVIEKLGAIFVRVIPEDTPASAAYLRVLTPAGKTGYVSVDAIAPLGNDQICYVKDGGGWKIGGYIGGGDPQ